MSKIGRQPVIIPQDVQIAEEKGTLRVSRGEVQLSVPVLKGVSYALKDGVMSFSITDTDAESRRNWGTTRSLFANAVQGATTGYKKTLLLDGVGYRMALSGNILTMSLGFSHPVIYTAPESISFEVENNALHISGGNKQLVGQVAAEIRNFRKVEPYKGKGFRYSDEIVRRKAGKKAAGST